MLRPLLNPTVNCRDIIDHKAYPLDEVDNPLRQQIIDQVQADLAEDGCAVIRHFISEAGLQQLLTEANDRKAQAYYSPNKMCNIYLGDGDAELPGDHPRNIFIPRTNGFVTAELLGEDTAAHQLYYWQPLLRFLADCLPIQGHGLVGVAGLQPSLREERHARGMTHEAALDPLENRFAVRLLGGLTQRGLEQGERLPVVVEPGQRALVRRRRGPVPSQGDITVVQAP